MAQKGKEEEEYLNKISAFCCINLGAISKELILKATVVMFCTVTAKISIATARSLESESRNVSTNVQAAHPRQPVQKNHNSSLV